MVTQLNRSGDTDGQTCRHSWADITTKHDIRCDSFGPTSLQSWTDKVTHLAT